MLISGKQNNLNLNFNVTIGDEGEIQICFGDVYIGYFTVWGEFNSILFNDVRAAKLKKFNIKFKKFNPEGSISNLFQIIVK